MVFDDKKFIAKKIQIARKNAGLTQEELAEKIGISSKQISRIERATYIPSLITFLKLIEILDININEFGVKNLSKGGASATRDKFIKLIYNLTCSELEFYYKTFETMEKNIYRIKNEKLKI